MGLLKELTTEYNDDPLPIFDALTESINQLSEAKKNTGMFKGVKNAAGLFAKNKGLTVKAVSKAIGDFDKMKTVSLRHTIKLHGKTPYEKRMIKSIVDAMTQKGGGYKVYRTRYSGGTKVWEIRRKDGGAYKHKRGQG